MEDDEEDEEGTETMRREVRNNVDALTRKESNQRRSQEFLKGRANSQLYSIVFK